LIKLSYTAFYAMKGGQRLSKEELLRLLVLADRYSMHGFMEECVDALMPFDGFDGALAFFRAVLDSLLWTEALREATEAADCTLAETLGPVETLWRPNGVYRTDVGLSHVFDESIVNLPVGAMEALLRSEKLQLKSENFTFSLALWWIRKQPEKEEERQLMLNRLFKSLRYARMSSAFLASIVDSDWVKDSGLLPGIMKPAIWRRDDVLMTYDPMFPASRVQEVDRETFTFTFTTHFTQAGGRRGTAGAGGMWSEPPLAC